MKYAVVIERGEKNYSAYVPDLPGCVSVGDNMDEILQMIHEAIQFHLEGMQMHGEDVPKPTTLCAMVEVGITSTTESGARP